MDLQKLRSRNADEVRTYVIDKFKIFNRFTYSKATRKKKCIQYYLAAEGSEHGQAVIERAYQDVYHQLFPLDEAESLAKQLEAKAKPKLESSLWLEKQTSYRDEVESTLTTLERWRRNQDYQEGESFFARLMEAVAFVDESILDPTQFSSEFTMACKAQINSSVAMTPEELEAKFDLMVGFEQQASCSFEAASVNWGVVNGKLEEAFKAGLWANGGAKLAMERLGFSAEVQAAIAIGAQLNVSGELTWSKGKGQLALGGSAEAFVGARAGGELKLSMSAIKGLEASIKAGAFAGFEATATGYCSFSYDGQAIAKVQATAGVAFGAGAEFEASIKAPIFGPTQISFGANLSLGFGVTAKTEAEINFSELALASSQEFRKVVYWRTLAKGYEMSLMNSDARNLYYLNKAISRLRAELEGTETTISSFQKVPMDKRPLLM
jgi:hypothetical protein